MPAEVKGLEIIAAEKLGQIATGYISSSALNAVARLGIADLLAERSLSISELATETCVHEDSLARILRLLCSIGVFEEVSDLTFSNNEVSEGLRSGVPNSQRDMITFVGDVLHFQCYADMLPTIRDGRTAPEHVWGKGIFEVLADDPAAQQRFDNAMTNLSQNAVAAILDAYDFTGIETLVDVAGGHGLLLTSILQRYPNMKGIVFDLTHVVSGANERIQQLGLSNRCEAVAGDFFQSVPQGDAIIMKHIIHDWDDDRAIAILKNCHRVLSAKGSSARLLLVEGLLASRNEPDFSKIMDVEMLMLPGGRERTEDQYGKLFDRAGFKIQQCIPTNSKYAIVEARPK